MVAQVFISNPSKFLYFNHNFYENFRAIQFWYKEIFNSAFVSDHCNK